MALVSTKRIKTRKTFSAWSILTSVYILPYAGTTKHKSCTLLMNKDTFTLPIFTWDLSSLFKSTFLTTRRKRRKNPRKWVVMMRRLQRVESRSRRLRSLRRVQIGKLYLCLRIDSCVRIELNLGNRHWILTDIRTQF